MGVRGELFSTKVMLQNRTYFFNVKENRLGDLYLNIVESKNRDEGGFERQSVILFAEDLQDFLGGFDDALRVLEKAAREKRRETQTREPRSREPRYKEPGNEQGNREQGYRDRRDKDQRNKETRRNDFRKPDDNRKPFKRQSSERRNRDDANIGKQRRGEDSSRNYSRKKVVVKRTTGRSRGSHD